MRSHEVAKRGIERAGRWLQGAKRALEDERWDDVVYCSQMTVEQSAKAVLFSLGVDFPREHDVSGAFVVLSGRKDLPRWFRELAPRISDTIAELARVRGQAGYGFEIGITAEYFRDYAPSAFRMAQKAHKGCSKLLREMFKNKL